MSKMLVGNHSGHICEFEFVKKPKALFVVFDGKRIAYRGRDKNWISMDPDYQVYDEDDRHKICVCFKGQPLH